MNSGEWFRVRPATQFRLFCFHHAGGGSQLFRDWQRRLGPDIDVVPVLLPGRERRIREPRIVAAERVVDALLEQMANCTNVPFAFFGHSMGALVSWRLAHARQTLRLVPPLALMVSACVAPQLPSSIPPMSALNDIALTAYLDRAGGLREELALRSEWMQIMLPILRDDFALCASSREDAHARVLHCPVLAFGGRDDPLVGEAELRAWQHLTSARTDVEVFDGGHFYLQAPASPLLERVAARIDEYRAALLPVPSAVHPRIDAPGVSTPGDGSHIKLHTHSESFRATH